MSFLVVGASQCRYLPNHLDPEFDVRCRSGTRVEDVSRVLNLDRDLSQVDVSVY